MGRLLHALAASAAASAVCAAGPALAAQPRASVQGDLDPELRAAIVRAIGDAERPVDNRFEARRRAEGAAEDATAVLRSEGYYASQVETVLGDEDTPTPAIRITPGPRFHLARPAIEWIGAAPDPVTDLAAQAALALDPGSPALAAEVVSAEGRAVSSVQDQGYADAKAEPRLVVVDHADTSMLATYRIASGPLVKLDGVKLTTNGRTRAPWVAGLAPWKSGDTYRSDDVATLERRLLDTGVFESVTVGLAPPAEAVRGLRPIIVSLSERKGHTLEAGASYGTNEGPGGDVRWTSYNRLGRADTLALFAKASKLDSRIGADLSLPHWRMPDQTLTLDAAAYKTQADAYNSSGFGLKADAQRHYTKTSYLTLGASIDLSRTNELKPGKILTPLGRDILTLGLLGDLALDRSNDPLNPTHGWRVNARAEPTLLAGKGTNSYLKLQTGGSAYFPFDKEGRTLLAARLRVGAILDGTVGDIPAPQRLYAGGGGSVRGFAYQGVGPRLADNSPQGGLSLIEGSVEVRHELTRTWGLVAFVDAGAVGSHSVPSFADLGIGAGFGVRYNLGFGPIRVDVAAPVSGRHGGAPFQVYVSIGQAF